MKNKCVIKKSIFASEVDSEYNLSLEKIVTLFQDAALKHTYDMKVDINSLVQNYNAFWVITKLKLKLNSLPKINDNIVVTTWPLKPTHIKHVRNFSITNGKTTYVEAMSEWCLLDYKTHKIRTIESINFPTKFNFLNKAVNVSKFEKFLFTNVNYAFSHKVMLSDIDCNKHTNNIVYLKQALNIFNSLDQIKNYTELECHYVSESFLGSNIDVYYKQLDNGYYIQEKCNDKICFELLIR